jgi:hypothetical protein
MVLESEIRYEKTGLIKASREVQAPARNKLRQRHGMEAGYLRFVTPLPDDNDNLP